MPAQARRGLQAAMHETPMLFGAGFRHLKLRESFVFRRRGKKPP
jgi:hypothetical protein